MLLPCGQLDRSRCDRVDFDGGMTNLRGPETASHDAPRTSCCVARPPRHVARRFANAKTQRRFRPSEAAVGHHGLNRSPLDDRLKHSGGVADHHQSHIPTELTHPASIGISCQYQCDLIPSASNSTTTPNSVKNNNQNNNHSALRCLCHRTAQNSNLVSSEKCGKDCNVSNDDLRYNQKVRKFCSVVDDFVDFAMGIGKRASAKPFVCWTVRSGHWLLLSAVMLAIYIPTAANAQKLTVNQVSSSKETGICQSVDIRNSLDTFDHLRGCRVVEGFVQILLFDKFDEWSFVNITFPNLTEITDYLLLYRVHGLKSLGTLFPNLAVIRGQKTFFSYSFVLFEMSHLQEIGLYSLTDIVHGLVRIDKNPFLCYVNTIDWDLIAKEGKGDEHFIKSNKQENECPLCPGDDGDTEGSIKCPLARHRDPLSLGPRPGRHLCWNRNHCQKVCPEHCSSEGKTCNGDSDCCHESCLGGCTGPGVDQCTVCKNLSIINGDKRLCTTKCPAESYEFLKRRCISWSECVNMTRPIDLEQDLKEKPYKPFNSSCLLHCPPNYFEEQRNNTFVCEPCKGRCQKECAGANVDSITSAQNLRGCTHIKGSLEIQIRGGRNVVKELEENLNMIEVIDGYLKIVRSFPLISLNFLKNLKEIRGNQLESQKYVLLVLDNQNLQELWDWDSIKNHTLKISNGRLFFHFNPKLCLNKIEKLRQITNLSDFTDMEVAPNSNGDKVACNVTVMHVNVTQIHSEVVILAWPKFQMEDARSLLGYVVHSIEAPYDNITLYDGRDGCGGDGWRVDDVSSTESEPMVYHILSQLKPYTQYAFYVRTYTIATERSGAQSPIYYFKTKPSQPSIPIKLSVHSPSPNKLIIKWEPPVHSNGNVTYYHVNASCAEDVPSVRNYCKDPLIPVVEESKLIPKTIDTTPQNSNETCDCNNKKYTRIAQKPDPEEDRVSQINFEDELHNRVYIKSTGVNVFRVGPDLRKKREIDNQKTTKYTPNKQLYPTGGVIVDADRTLDNQTGNKKCVARYHKVVANTSFVMEDLPHFTLYTVSVQACRERESGDTENQSVCSTETILTRRTLKAEGVDNITHVQVFVQSSNHTTGMVRLTWDEPENPNSIIVTYQIEYRRVDIENIKSMIECITRQEFINKSREYILKDLPAGNYSVRVMATSLAGNGAFSPYNYFFINEAKTGSTTEVVVGIIVVLLLVCCAGVGYFYMRRKFTPSVPNMKLIASVNPEYVSTVYVPDDWEVPRKKIELLRELGQGSFGMVYEGIARDVVKGKPEIRCAIKTVNEHATDRERIEFLNEASVMKAFDTTHVVRLLGVVSQGQPTLVVMELMANGDLKSYLRSHRPDAETYDPAASRQPPTLKRILQMAIEIADGMAYLAAKKFVHRDLAARNCMVAEDLTVKIGDFGMTRDIYETDYYRKGTKGLLPVRWMAPESLKDGVFTSNSDVWSYGVVLWEMATLASQPYQGLSNDQVLRYVIDGGIMERPENCPDKLYNLMRICWQHKPSLRPSFLSLATMLLEDACSTFKQVSFYHSTAGIEARTIHNAAQDDPSTPLRLTKEIEDFSLGSGSDQDSEPEDLVDDGADSDFDDKHVTINFPGYQVASFKGNQKSLDTSGPSLYSYKDNDRSQDTSGPSFGSYSEQSRHEPRLFGPRDLKRSVESLQSGTGRDSLLKESEGSGSAEANTTVNGYVGGRPSTNNSAVKTTQC